MTGLVIKFSLHKFFSFSRKRSSITLVCWSVVGDLVENDDISDDHGQLEIFGMVKTLPYRQPNSLKLGCLKKGLVTVVS